jgi:hypothetical protein
VWVLKRCARAGTGNRTCKDCVDLHSGEGAGWRRSGVHQLFGWSQGKRTASKSFPTGVPGFYEAPIVVKYS